MSTMMRPTSQSATPEPIESIMTEEDEDCVVFLMTLKYSNVTPGVLDRPKKNIVENRFQQAFTIENNEAPRPREVGFYRGPSTGPTRNMGRPLLGISRKNDTLQTNNNKSPLVLPLSLPEDKLWLSDIQCYVRSQCVEVFSATEGDVTHPGSFRGGGSELYEQCSPVGRRTPVTVGRVGIRCAFCRDVAPSRRATQSTSFPSQINGIYEAVSMMYSRHFPNCQMMPSSVRRNLAGMSREAFPSINNFNMWGGSLEHQQYWAESAMKLGLIDTRDGIRIYHKTEKRPCALPAFSSISSAFEAEGEASHGYERIREHSAPQSDNNSVASASSSDVNREVTPEPSFSLSGPTDDEPPFDLSLPSSLEELLCGSTLVFPEDKDLIPDYLFIAMAQMKRCNLEEADRVGCYKSRDIGFVGMCCKHCGGQPGFGKYFPASVRSLAQTTTSQTIVKHISAKCAHVPPNVRKAILALQRDSQKEKGPAQITGDGRPRYGSRKVFFQRVWDRIHGKDGSTTKDNRRLRPQSSNQPSTSTHLSRRCVISPFPGRTTEDDATEEASVAGSCSSSSGEETADSYYESTRLCDYEVEAIVDQAGAGGAIFNNQNRRVYVSGANRRTPVPSAKKRQPPTAMVNYDSAFAQHDKTKRRRFHR